MIGTRESIKRDDGTEKTTGFNVGPQLNVSVSGWRLRGAYLLRNEEGCSPESSCYAGGRHFRVLLGADIVRLITGEDTAVTKGSDDAPSSGDG